jgi:hypothetical protein
VRRHIAHARSVLNTPVTIVKIPIMRFIFVSVERFDEAVVISEAIALCFGGDWYVGLPMAI